MTMAKGEPPPPVATISRSAYLLRTSFMSRERIEIFYVSGVVRAEDRRQARVAAPYVVSRLVDL